MVQAPLLKEADVFVYRSAVLTTEGTARTREGDLVVAFWRKRAESELIQHASIFILLAYMLSEAKVEQFLSGTGPPVGFLEFFRNSGCPVISSS